MKSPGSLVERNARHSSTGYPHLELLEEQVFYPPSQSIWGFWSSPCQLKHICGAEKRWNSAAKVQGRGFRLSPEDGFSLEGEHQHGDEECHLVLAEPFSGGTG